MDDSDLCVSVGSVVIDVDEACELESYVLEEGIEVEWSCGLEFDWPEGEGVERMSPEKSSPHFMHRHSKRPSP